MAKRIINLISMVIFAILAWVSLFIGTLDMTMHLLILSVLMSIAADVVTIKSK